MMVEEAGTRWGGRPLLVRVIFVLLLYLTLEGISLAGLVVLRRVRGIEFFPAATTRPGARKALDEYLVAPSNFPPKRR